MNQNWMIFNLAEAQELIGQIQEEIRCDTPDDEKEVLLQAAFEHLYHHINSAWNGRVRPLGFPVGQTDEDFNSDRQMPKDIATALRKNGI